MFHLAVHFQVFHASATGSRLRNVVCEKCGDVFYYQLARLAYGQASSLYGMFPDAAQRRAQKAADKLLARLLDREVELVPCPACNWVSTRDIATFRRSRFLDFSTAAWFALIAGVLLDVFFYFFAQNFFAHPPALLAKEIQIVTVIAVGAAALLWITQMLLRARINPNQAQGLPRVPPGTPPALRQITGPDGEKQFIPVPREYAPPPGRLWAVYRPGQLVFDRVCCECLGQGGPATRKFKIPMSEFLQPPLCAACYARIRARWWQKTAAALVVALLSAGAAFFLIDFDFGGKLAVAGIAAFFALAAGIAIVQHSSKPFRQRSVDKQRGIERVSFRNPAYTALLIRRLGEQDGVRFD